MRHLDVELLQAALAGDLPVKVLMRHILAHLAELCPDCREAVASLRQAIETRPRPGEIVKGAASEAGEEELPVTDGDLSLHRLAEPHLVGVFDGAFDRASGVAKDWAARVRRERRRARADVRELVRTPADARARKIERAQTRYRSRAVAELLLEESRRLVRDQPTESRSLAALVETVLLWIPGAENQDWARDLGVRAQAWIANTFRVEYDLRAAARKLTEVRARMGRELVGERVHAEIASLEASLRFDQGRHEEARRLLDRAAVLYRAGRNGELLAKVLSKKALLEDRLGDQATAAAVQREALALLSEAEQPQLFRESIANLALFLVNGGRVREAAEVLVEHATALRDAEMWEAPRLQIIRGRVAFAFADLAEAERLFLAARAELIRRKDPVRAAVASLDLAVLYLAQGKTDDLRRMARLMGSIFDSAELESEALAAVVLFQRAVQAESVTEAAIRAWRRQLEVARVGSARKPQVS